MKKFLVLYKLPVAGLDAWKAKPEEETKAATEKMMADWNNWMATLGGKLTETAGAGKTMLVTKAGTTDSRNDIMLYSIAEAETHEEAAKYFENCPHLDIPESTIEIMAINYLPGK
jgi:hypothetical protein